MTYANHKLLRRELWGDLQCAVWICIDRVGLFRTRTAARAQIHLTCLMSAAKKHNLIAAHKVGGRERWVEQWRG